MTPGKPTRNELIKILPPKSKPNSESTPEPAPAPAPEPAPEPAPAPEPEPVIADTQELTEDTVNSEAISNTEEKPADTEVKRDDSEQSGAIFQAVGVITGEIKFTDEGKSSVTIGRREYPLFYAPRKQKAFEALKKEIEATGEHTQRLIVYPKIIHFPKREQPAQITFQLVGFDRGRQAEAVSGELQDLEFKLCGLWQFIPVCQTPCISVFRNFNKERLEYIKQAELAKKVKFMKASHLPVIWRDGPVRPFRFNPKATKEEQGHPAFVQIKARFLPQRDVFGFVEQLAEPTETAPKFLKASKQDKASAQAAKKAAKRDKPPVQAEKPAEKPAEKIAKPKPKPKV